MSRSFEPSADGLSVAAASAALVPQRTTGGEVGVKAEVIPSRLEATVALFQAQENISETNPLTGIVSNIGDQRSRGINTSLGGYLSPEWRVVASYCLMDPTLVHAGVDAAGILLDGHLVGLAPRNSASLFTIWGLPEGFGIGGGATYQGGRYTANDDLIGLPAYTVVNGVLTWRHGPWRARLNLDNLLNHRYIATAGEGTDYTGQTVLPGAPIHASVTVSWRF